jgi:hypothetical protein
MCFICACPSVSGQPSVDGVFLRGWHFGEPLLSTSFDTLELLLLLLPVLPPLHCHPLCGTACSVQVSLLASLSCMSPDTATESKFSCKLSWTVANPKLWSVSYTSRTTGSKAKQLNGALWMEEEGVSTSVGSLLRKHPVINWGIDNLPVGYWLFFKTGRYPTHLVHIIPRTRMTIMGWV